MIEDELKNLNTIRLSGEVKTRMRGELMAYAELHAPASVHAQTTSATSLLRGFSVRVYTGFAIALLLIVSVTGTAFAAENTLPGDVLYSVKVGITEPIQTALVPSERGKAAWNAILAERRLEEAAELAAQNKLTPAAQTELAANFTEHVNASESHAARLERTGDTSGSLSAQSDLEARLTAHEQILDVIDAHYAIATSTDTAQTKGSLTQLLAMVRSRQDAITSSRVALEDAIAPHSGDTSRTATSSASTTVVAIARAPVSNSPSPLRFRHSITPAARIAGQNVERAQEVNAILDHHASLLAKFLPPAQASTTATTTLEVGSTTPAVSTTTVHLEDQKDKENVNR